MKNKPYPYYETEHINNLKELVEVGARKHGNKTAFSYEYKKADITISYNEFKSDTEALGTVINSFGIHNAKIALLGENSYEWILSYFAVTNSGNIIIPIDKELPANDVLSLINHAEADIFIYSSNYSDTAAHIQKSEVSVKQYINMDDLPVHLKNGRSIIQQGDKSVINHKINNDNLAVIVYTSGTTGNAKGVMLSHKSLASNIVSICRMINLPDSNLLFLPLHHMAGVAMGVMVYFHHGSNIAINRSIKKLQNDFLKYKPKSFLLVPLIAETLYKKIWDGAKREGKDKLLAFLIKISNALLVVNIDIRRVLFKSVYKAFGGNIISIGCGAAHLDGKYVNAYRELGIIFAASYGLTECSGLVSVNRNNYYRAGSEGLVLPSCELKIADKDENGHGEICVKGDGVMLGYYKDEQATKEAFDDNWLKTGDIGYLDDDGFLYICGRKKNMILLSNGKNVYPEDMEFALAAKIPYIIESVVYEDNGQIAVEVFLDKDNYPECANQINDDILSFNREQPPYKNISKVTLRDTEFPKTTTKKIKRAYRSGGNDNA